MSTLHWDTETHAIRPDEQTPPVVCLQAGWRPTSLVQREPGGEATIADDPAYPWREMSALDLLGPVPDDEAGEHDDPAEDYRPRAEWPDDTKPVLLVGDDMIDWYREALSSDHLLQGLNVSFDLLVMLRQAERRGLNLWRATFEMLAAGRLRDTEVDEKLLLIARGIEVHKTGMEALAWRYLGLDLKADKGPASWRLRYQELDGVPLERWPYHPKRYALSDVLHDREIARRQEDVAIRLFGSPSIPDQVACPVAAFCLHLQSSRGVVTDYPRALNAKASLSEISDKLMGVLVQAGLVRSKTIFTGSGAVEEGEACTVEGSPATYVYRCTIKGERSSRARSALVEYDDGEQAIVDLAKVEAETGIKHTKNMTEIRRRIAETLKAIGYSDRDLPTTETGLVKTDRETLEIIAGVSEDPGLLCLAAKSKVDKLLSTYILALCTPNVMHWRYDALKATGRTSAGGQRFFLPSDEGTMIRLREGTNVQNFPGRAALLKAAREVFPYLDPSITEAPGAAEKWAAAHDPRAMVVARPGYIFSIYDYSAIELGTMARVLNVLFGKPSTLANVINSGKDVHLHTGVRVHQTLWGETYTYEELVALRAEAEAIIASGGTVPEHLERVLQTRKMSKIVGFGFLGGMGAAKFQLYAWTSYGVRVTLEQSKSLRRAFLATYPEIPIYFRAISDRLQAGLPIIQLGSKRVRRGCTYAAGCNSPFQGLAADGAKQALWRLTWASYVDEESPLFGSFPLIFEHDAFITEVPDDDRADAAHAEVGRLMIEGMNVYLVDRRRPELTVKVSVEGGLIRRRLGDPHSRWIK